MEEKRTYDFWPYNIAKELIANWKSDKQVITTGTSMSGDPHIGSANDVIRGDAIKLAVEKIGHMAELVWISDDMDPFRSVPADMPKELEDYLGVPASLIPDFWNDGHPNFVEHFEEKFLKQLEKVHVKPTIRRGIDMYKAGMYNDVILIAMDRKMQIIDILNKFRENKLDENWWPVDVICEECNRISTTKITDYDRKSRKVEYFCNPDEILLHRKNPVSGCGHKGKVSILDGRAKLTWRVEWAARWVFLKSTCEPFGKEHAAAGGSWDTGKEIVEKIYNYKPPRPIEYEHFLVNGEKMSKSKGNVISLDDMLRYMLPEHVRYWMFQGRLTIAKDIVLKSIAPHVFDEFDEAEDVYFGKKLEDEREANNLKKAYELSIVKIPHKETTIHISFRTIENAVRLYPEDPTKALSKDFKIDRNNLPNLKKKIEIVKNYLADFGEKQEKKEVKIDKEDKKVLKQLIETIKKEKDADELQKEVANIAKSYEKGMKEFFKLVYNILLGTDAGPRLGVFIIEKGKKEIIKRLEDAL